MPYGKSARNAGRKPMSKRYVKAKDWHNPAIPAKELKFYADPACTIPSSKPTRLDTLCLVDGKKEA